MSGTDRGLGAERSGGGMAGSGPVGAPLGGSGVRGGSAAMFDRIARRYDLINRLQTFGLDQRWRRLAVRSLALGAGAEVLDVATGTADLALRIAVGTPAVRVVGLDPSGGMLAVAAAKVARAGAGRVSLVRGSATALPFRAGRFDGVSISFGIRNVPDRPAALREMARVLRPGGRLAVLEATEPGGGPIGWAVRFHLRRLVPWLGALFGRRAEYRYLPASVAAFPSPSGFCRELAEAGFADPVARRFLGGGATLFTARRDAPLARGAGVGGAGGGGQAASV